MADNNNMYSDFRALERECCYSLEADISYNKGDAVPIPGGLSTKALLSISLGLWSPCISCTSSYLDLPSTEGCDESSDFFHSSVVPFRWTRLRFGRR